MNTNCPSCGTAFKVGPADDGKQFTCFKCGAALLVTRDGIQALNAAAMAAPSAGPAPSVPPAAPGGSSPRPRGRGVDIATWLFGVGAFLVILFLFLPLIDRAKAQRSDAALRAGEQKNKREMDKKPGNPADEELRKKSQETWDKEKQRLEEIVGGQEVSARSSDYWYAWGMMVGFMLLAGAALGYLDPGQPPIRRIVGAIVILTEVVLIFLRFVLDLRH